MVKVLSYLGIFTILACSGHSGPTGVYAAPTCPENPRVNRTEVPSQMSDIVVELVDWLSPFPDTPAIGKVIQDESVSDVILPSRFDWREANIMTPVKHQMNLGSCGVFAAVSVFESLIRKETGKTADLSEQQIINGSQDWAPSGISSKDAMKYMVEHGLVNEQRLPYEDKLSERLPTGAPDYRLTGYSEILTYRLPLEKKIKTIKQAVLLHGPVATNMIFYQDLDRYQEGIYVYDGHAEEQGGHWVVIVGWQDDPEVKNGGYWICRNSWGEKWGEEGYFKIAYGECGIDDFYFVYGIYNP